MQITAVALWQMLRQWEPSWTLNLVCCYMPAWLLVQHSRGREKWGGEDPGARASFF